MNSYYVYEYTSAITDKLLYIGRGRDTNCLDTFVRAKHLRGHPYVVSWLLKTKGKVRIRILARNLGYPEALTLETALIRHSKPLLNRQRNTQSISLDPTLVLIRSSPRRHRRSKKSILWEIAKLEKVCTTLHLDPEGEVQFIAARTKLRALKLYLINNYYDSDMVRVTEDPLMDRVDFSDLEDLYHLWYCEEELAPYLLTLFADYAFFKSDSCKDSPRTKRNYISSLWQQIRNEYKKLKCYGIKVPTEFKLINKPKKRL